MDELLQHSRRRGEGIGALAQQVEAGLLVRMLGADGVDERIWSRFSNMRMQ